MIPIALTLAQYRTLVSNLPTPTTSQMEAFAEFVSNAHSWYKHLPMKPPGAPFQFFLDPSAGMQRIVTEDGLVQAVSREKTGFHYSWIPTKEYEHLFGCLAFSRSTGTSVSLISVKGDAKVGSDDEPMIYDGHKRQLFRLPDEVLEAGLVSVSGVVHTLSAGNGWWDFFDDYTDLDWPEESGGRQALREIRERCRELREHPERETRIDDVTDPRVFKYPNIRFVDLPLYQLLAPERQRQQRQMVLAMMRVCALLQHDFS